MQPRPARRDGDRRDPEPGPRRERRRSRPRMGRRRDHGRRRSRHRSVPGDELMRALAIVCLLSSPAYAGRTLYGWLAATDTVAEGGLGLQTSVYEDDDLGKYHAPSSALVWTPALGLTDKLELAVPVELAYITADDVAPGVSITHYGAEIRYRFLPRGSELSPLLRVGLARDATVRSQVRTELAAA